MRKIIAGLLTLTFFTANLFANEVVYFWSGAVTSTSGKVNVVLQSPSEKVRLVVSIDKVFSQPKYSETGSAKKENGNVVSLTVHQLQPNTTYYYCIEIDGTKDRDEKHIGSFHTFVEGPYSFKFVAGACNFFPNNRVYDKMRMQDPLFFLMPGDLHYSNPSSADPEPHRSAYEELILQQPRESRFLKDIPIAYVWDDHDFCGDNNDGTSGCGLAAYTAYNEYVPHYTFGAPEGSHSIYQAFTVGRVRFIMSDLRSERREGDIMSATQKTWFKNEILNAKKNGQVICWVSSVSFSGTKPDNWGGYTSSREELSNFFRDNEINNLFIICGDAHMLAIDNGTHTDFSTGKNNSSLYPLLQSAALNNVGSDKGGEYSEGGTFPNPAFSSQWSTVEVTDNGLSEICVRFTCYRMNLFTKRVKILTQYEFCRTIPEPLDQAANPLQVQKDGNTLNINLQLAGKYNLRIIDDKGKLLYNQPEVALDKLYKVDATNWQDKGIYYVIAESDKSTFISKIEFNR
jgi:hypothetical protein